MCLFPSFTFCFVVAGCRLSVVGSWFYSEISNPTNNPQPTTHNRKPATVPAALPADISRNKKQEYLRRKPFFILHSSFFIKEEPLCQPRYRLDAPPRTDNQTSISISGIRL